MKKIISTITFLLGIVTIGFSQTDSLNKHFLNTNIEYEIRAQFSIGGSSPLGLPREIRKIESFNPGLQLGLEANATKWLTDEKKWGVRLGVRFESKGMKTKARVKNYLTEIVQDQSKVRGYYTGLVQTDVKNTYVTVPVLAVYNVADKWNLYGGFYFSALIDNSFTGYVSDGYLRQNTPVGTKITFEDGSFAPYDFSNELNKFQWGTQLGSEWQMNRHFKIFADLTYGFNNILKNDFTSIDFKMHNIYLNLGFGYKF